MTFPLQISMRLTVRPNSKYYVPKEIRRLILKGKIYTQNRCQKCHVRFTPEHQDSDGFFCPEHLTRPTQYFVDVRTFGIGQLYRHPETNKLFKNYTDAEDFLITLNTAFKESERKGIKWSPENWLPVKIAEKRVEFLIGLWLRNYQVELEKGAKSKTRVHQITVACKYIEYFFKGSDIRDIDRDGIERFYHSLLDKNLSSRYIKDILDTLKALLTRYTGKVPQMPTFVVVPHKEKQRLGFTREISALDKVPERHGYRLAILVLLRTGMRLGEVSAIKVVDLVDGEIYVDKAISGNTLRFARKSGNGKSYKVSPEIWQMLMNHVEGKDEDRYVFSIGQRYISPGRLYKVWRKACSIAGVKHISLQQASRHSTATEIKRKYDTEAQKAIAEQLGHNNLQTQKHYIVD